MIRARRTWFLLKLGYRCNNRCLYCHAAPHLGVDLSTQAALARIQRAADLGAGGLVLSGGEPTLRRDLRRLVAKVHELGLDLGLVTNGRALAYPRMRGLLLEAGLTYVQVSVAAGEPEAADRLVQVPGAWRQAVSGIEGLVAEADRPLLLTVSCVLTRPALDHLDGLGELMLRLAARRRSGAVALRLKLAALEPEGRALEVWEEVGVGLQEVGRAVRGFAQEWADRLASAGVQLCEEALPACVGHGIDCRADLWSDGVLAMAEAFEPDFVAVDDANKSRLAVCLDCSLDDCPGPYRLQAQKTGFQGFRAVSGERPPEFLLLPGREVGQGSCPVLDGLVEPPEPGRGLLTLRQGHWRLWHVAGEDFGPRARVWVLRDLEQVYAEVEGGPERGGPGHPFQRAVKLRRSRRCARCRFRLVCGGAYVVQRPDPVARDEALLGEVLARTEGRVLDVGSGWPGYLERIAELVEAGRITYLGVDPEAPPVERGPKLRFVRGRAEDLEGSGTWDWILSIRALSHYESPVRFLEAARRLLRPGGRLLVVWDSPHAMLRQEVPPEPGGREHRRNLWPWDVRLLEAASGFVTEWERLVSPGTSNLNFWIGRPPMGSSTR